MMLMLRLVYLSIAIAIAATPNAQASRYSISNPNVVEREQDSPLDVRVTLQFPRIAIATVGDAVEHALVRSGYRLAPSSADQDALFALPLPDVHRAFEDQRLAVILATLGKPGYRLVVDHVHRLVTYERRPSIAGVGEEGR